MGDQWHPAQVTVLLGVNRPYFPPMNDLVEE